MAEVIKEMDALIGRALRHNAGAGSVARILEMAVELETLTKNHYIGLSRKVGNKTGSVMFSYLAIEEAGQIKELTILLDTLKKDRKLLKKEKVSGGVCPVPLPGEKEIKKAKDLVPDNSKVGRDASDLEALKLAIEVKKRAIRFYCAAMEHVGNAEAKRLLAKVAAMENKHLNELMVQYAWLDQAGFWYDPSMMTD